MGDLVSGTTNQEGSIDDKLPPTEELAWPQPQWLVSLIKWRRENGGFFNYIWLSDEPEEKLYSHLDDSDPVHSFVKSFFKGMLLKDRLLEIFDITIFVIRVFFGLSPLFTGMGLIIAEGWRRHMRRKTITTSSEELPIQQESEEAEGLGSPSTNQQGNAASSCAE